MTGAVIYLKSLSFFFLSSISNLASEQIIAVWWRHLKDGSSTSYSYSKSLPLTYLLWPLLTSPSYQRFSTVILFWVKVPVLSEQMHDVEPSVSTASKFLTKTCLSANFLAVMASEIVMQAKSPSGTLATKIPIPKMMHWRAEYLTTKRARKKKTTPKVIAITVIIKTNRSS